MQPNDNAMERGNPNKGLEPTNPIAVAFICAIIAVAVGAVYYSSDRAGFVGRCESILTLMLHSPSTLDIVDRESRSAPEFHAHITYDAENLHGGTVRGSITCSGTSHDRVQQISVDGKALSDMEVILWDGRATRGEINSRF